MPGTSLRTWLDYSEILQMPAKSIALPSGDSPLTERRADRAVSYHLQTSRRYRYSFCNRRGILFAFAENDSRNPPHCIRTNQFDEWGSCSPAFFPVKIHIPLMQYACHC